MSDNGIFCIRGIGSMHGLFSHMFFSPTNGEQTALLCFHKGDQLIYSNPDYNYCGETSIVVETIDSDNGIKMYYQILDESLVLELYGDEIADVSMVQIFNESGTLIKSCNIDNTRIIKIDQLPADIYIYQVISKNGQKNSGKILITQ